MAFVAVIQKNLVALCSIYLNYSVYCCETTEVLQWPLGCLAFLFSPVPVAFCINFIKYTVKVIGFEFSYIYYAGQAGYHKDDANRQLYR